MLSLRCDNDTGRNSKKRSLPVDTARSLIGTEC